MKNEVHNSQLDGALEADLTRTLERQPVVVVPEGFAARVAGSLPPRRPVRRRVQTGRTVAMVAAWIVALTMFALAPHAAPNFGNLTFDMELLLLAQLAAIAYWLGARRET
jgi:hypothetical protein